MRSPEMANAFDQEFAVTRAADEAAVSGTRRAVEHDRAVGLVADHRHRSPCTSSIASSGRQRFRRIDRAGRIVRRVEQDGAGARRHGGAMRRDPAESRVRLHYDHAAGVILDVEAVLREVGHQHDHFVAGVEHGLEHRVDRARANPPS